MAVAFATLDSANWVDVSQTTASVWQTRTDSTSGISGVILRVIRPVGTSAAEIRARAVGQTEYVGGRIRGSSMATLICPVDGSGQFQVYAGNNSIIYTIGYTYSVGVTMLSEPLEITPSGYNSWVAYDLSGLAGFTTAPAAIIAVRASADDLSAGFRHGDDSTGWNYDASDCERSGVFIVGTDAAGSTDINVFLESSSVQAFLVGYVSDGITMLSSPTEIAPTAGAFEGQTAPSGGYCMLLDLSVSAGGATSYFNCRKTGETITNANAGALDLYLGSVNKGFTLTNGVAGYDVYRSSTNLKIQLVGYATFIEAGGGITRTFEGDNLLDFTITTTLGIVGDTLPTAADINTFSSVSKTGSADHDVIAECTYTTSATITEIQALTNCVVATDGATVQFYASSSTAGTATYSYRITDTVGVSNLGTVTVTLTNSTPVVSATAPILICPKGETITFYPLDGSTNPPNKSTDVAWADDADNETLRYEYDSATATPSAGTVVLDTEASIAGTYTHDDSGTLTDSFGVLVTDGDGATDTFTVSVTITQPVAVNDEYEVELNSTDNVLSVLDNDVDSIGNGLTITSVSTPSNGSVSRFDSYVSYTPNPGYTGSDSFTYTISDGETTDTAIVTITVVENVLLVSQTFNLTVNRVVPLLVSFNVTATTSDGTPVMYKKDQSWIDQHPDAFNDGSWTITDEGNIVARFNNLNAVGPFHFYWVGTAIEGNAITYGEAIVTLSEAARTSSANIISRLPATRRAAVRAAATRVTRI